MAANLTTITVTHLAQGFEKNPDLEPPSKKLLDKTFESYYEYVDGTDDSQHLLIYNVDSATDEKEKEYKCNICEICEEYDVELIVRSNKGLRPALKTALKRINSEYIMFLEHDWKFIRKVNLNDLINLMEMEKSINYIRFNKRKTRETGEDTILNETIINNTKLTKTSNWSNNPHIARTKVYRKWISLAHPLKYMLVNLFKFGLKENGYIREPIRRYRPKNRNSKQGTGDNIESLLNRYYKRLIDVEGFERAHAMMGVYIYGGCGENPYIDHLGE
jgi:hypothetical protein